MSDRHDEIARFETHIKARSEIMNEDFLKAHEEEKRKQLQAQLDKEVDSLLALEEEHQLMSKAI